MIPGAIYGQGYHELDSHCFAYIHATEVGGTHPALIEAMGRGALVLYRDTPENAEVAGDAGIPFGDDLAGEDSQQTLAMSEADREALRRRACERVAQRLLLGCRGDGLRKPVPVDNEMMPPPYRSYVLVSLDQIARNYRNVRAAVGTGVEVMAVVKADAYGHGALAVSRTLIREGAKWLAVSSVDEGVTLRLAGIAGAHPGDGRISAAGAGSAGGVRSHTHRALARRHRGAGPHGGTRRPAARLSSEDR